jgi:hypothetical protein
MDAGGLAADEQLLGDLAVGASLHQQPQDLKLTGGETGQGALGRQPDAKVEAAPAGQRLQRWPNTTGWVGFSALRCDVAIPTR